MNGLRIACAADEKYVGHAAAMLHSVFEQANGTDVEVHFLHAPEFAPSARVRLHDFVGRHGAAIEFHRVEADAIAGLPAMPGIPRIMWYRIFLPDLLPDIDRILYLDADTIVVDDLRPLLDLPLDDNYVAAVTNVLEAEHADHPDQLGLAADSYFNSGVLLLNLRQMRSDGCTQELVRYARETELLWPDQDALNAVLGRRRIALHPRWNCMNSLFLFPQASAVFGPGALHEARRHPAIVHFEGPMLAKPWHYLSKHPYRRTYERHRAATPWPEYEIEGRTWPHRLLRPLPTRATIAVLSRWLRLRARVVNAR